MFNIMNRLNRLSRHNSTKMKKLLKNVSNLSTQVAIKTDPIVEIMKDVEEFSRITSKSIAKKPQRPPFAKNLFLGVFDRDMLTYPEILDKATVDALHADSKPIQDFFQDAYVHGEQKLTRQFLENLSRLKLLGLQASSAFGCRQLSLTEACRFYESISHNTSCVSVIFNEVLGIQTLLKTGNDSLKEKYIRSLVDGKTVVAHCIAESSGQAIKTKAKLSGDGKYWILNGNKTAIINGDTADLFFVLAQTDVPDERGLTVGRMSVLLVERTFGGVTSNPCRTVGLEQTDVSDVTFDNTPVPVENVIGVVNQGEKVVVSVMREIRLATGPMCSAILRRAIDNFVKYCVEVDGNGNNFTSSEAIQSRLGEMTTTLYAIESMTYLTSSLVDEYENQDCDLETAIVKVFTAEHCYDSIKKCMECIGTPAFMYDHWCSRLQRDSLSHLLLNEPTDGLTLIVALLGLQHAGEKLQETVKQFRNPLFHPAAAFKRMLTQRKHIRDKPSLDLHLCDYLHPSLLMASELLEYSVLRLQFATETSLVRFGPEIMNKHQVLRRLAESVVDIYAMTAVIGRASRSYCIGLQHAYVELQIANAFCLGAKERVQKNVEQIWQGDYVTTDEKFMMIAKQAFKSGGYFPEHPLARNF